MKITETFEWVKLVGDAAVCGITAKGRKELGEIVHVEFPEVGKVLSQSEEAVILESMKAAVDSLAPISGEVIEVNRPLIENLQFLNHDPEGKGWLFKLRPTLIEEYNALPSYGE